MADDEDVWVDSIEEYSKKIEIQKAPEPSQSEQEPRWEKVPKGEEVKHMYLDPRNQITGGFGGVKRVDFGQREKRINDLKKQLDEATTVDGRQKIRKEIIEMANGMRFHRANYTGMIQKICSQYRQDYCKIQSNSHLHNPQNDYLRQRQKHEKAVADEQAAVEKAKQLEKELEIKLLEKPKESTQPAQPMSAASQANAKVPPQIAQQKELSASVYGGREEDLKIDSKQFTQQRDENSLWNNKKPKNQNVIRHNQHRAPQNIALVNHAINQAQEPPMSNTHCSVCDVYFCGDIPAKQHYAGQKHAKKLKRFQITGGAASLAPAVVPPLPVKTQVGMNLEYCELCEMKLSPNPIEATAHYSSRGHLKFLKIDADSPGLPGKSSRQRLGEERRYTGTWADEIQVLDIPEWGRPRFNRMGHRIKLKGVANGPGCQPIPGEDKAECRFCDAKFSDGRQAINHYMGKKHQVRLIQTACQAPRKELQSAELILSGSQQAQKIVLGFSR